MPLRLLVFGGRDYADRTFVYRALDHLHGTRVITEVIQGGAPGADTLALDWCGLRGVPCVTVPAEWDRHGRAAGPIRNRAMLDLKPDAAVGFPGGRGSADMKRQCQGAGVPVWEPAVTA